MVQRIYTICKPNSIRHTMILLITSTALGGCVANSSNPRATAASASMDNQGAHIVLRLSNPGGRDLTVQGLDYELSHGEMAFPLGSGRWSGELDLPAKGENELPLNIVFDTEPIEEDSSVLHMIGTLHFKDHTGFLGLKSMNLTQTSVQIEIQAERKQP